MNAEKRVDAETKRLKELFKDIEPGKYDVVEQLIQNAAFLSVILQDMQKDIIAKGYTEKYVHGENQQGYKMAADLQSYNTTLKSYNSTVKTLLTLLPKNSRAITGSKLQSLIEEIEEI